MNLIKATKLTGAKRLHRKYELLNDDGFVFYEEHTLDNNVIEFPSEVEYLFLEEVEKFKDEQKIKLAIELRKVNIPKVKDSTQEQGTKEWLQARAGIITASKTPFNVDGNKIPTYNQYVNEKVAESFRLKNGGAMKENYQSEILSRGNELEPLAVERYEDITNNKVVLKGLITSQDSMIGASPDGITSDKDFNTINIEIKSVLLQNYIAELSDNKVSKSYKAQMQVQMYILNVDMTHMLIQCQEELDTELGLIIREVKRDEEFISNMIETLKCFEIDFNDRMTHLENSIVIE